VKEEDAMVYRRPCCIYLTPQALHECNYQDHGERPQGDYLIVIPKYIVITV